MAHAPYFADVADGPAEAQPAWLRTADELRVRVVTWPLSSAKGTVLLFPGRTEYCEKYARAAVDFHARGYAVITIDWRGQGLADRILPDARIGHVGDFADYQHDVRAMLAHARQTGLPEPYFLVAHSMGGCIGLRALMENLPVKAAMFSAPMWGINLSRAMRPVAWGLSGASRALRIDLRIAPGQRADNYLNRTTLLENALTRDADMFGYMQRQLDAHPELGLGGPSLWWLNRSLREMRALSQRPTPRHPAISFLGTDETIVDPARVRARMADWPNGELHVVQGGKHEMMMDTPETRRALYDKTAAFFARHA